MDAAALAADAGDGHAEPRSRVELEIGGMTCASCANRIEKKLNRLDGVSASVNYATEKAVVSAPVGFDPTVLIAEVEKTGYTRRAPPAAGIACRRRARRPRAHIAAPAPHRRRGAVAFRSSRWR